MYQFERDLQKGHNVYTRTAATPHRVATAAMVVADRSSARGYCVRERPAMDINSKTVVLSGFYFSTTERSIIIHNTIFLIYTNETIAMAHKRLRFMNIVYRALSVYSVIIIYNMDSRLVFLYIIRYTVHTLA